MLLLCGLARHIKCLTNERPGPPQFKGTDNQLGFELVSQSS